MADGIQTLPDRPSYVVIGTSAGGMAALPQLFKDLPQDFPGAILVVLHVSQPRSAFWLAEHLAAAGRMPVKVAEDGEAIRQGTAYIAPAGTHLLVERNYVSLGTGPLEQHVRPAIDALFRSAARVFGARAIGVILTGMLRDGTQGLRAIRDAGGITIVQNPRQAQARDMPSNAMQGLGVDHCLDLPDIAPMLELLVRRAGPYKHGALETGLAASRRLMNDRLLLLTRLSLQSLSSQMTTTFLDGEISALRLGISDLDGLIARQHRNDERGSKPKRAVRTRTRRRTLLG